MPGLKTTRTLAALTAAKGASPTVAAEISRTQADYDKAVKEASSKKDALDSAKKKLEDAKTLEESAVAAAASISSYVSASAAGTVQVGTISMPGREKLTDKAVEQIGTIAKQVLVQGFTFDKCFDSLREIAAMNDRTVADRLHADVSTMCLDASTIQRAKELFMQLN